MAANRLRELPSQVSFWEKSQSTLARVAFLFPKPPTNHVMVRFRWMKRSSPFRKVS